jgi:hypothetical protein
MTAGDEAEHNYRAECSARAVLRNELALLA